MTALDYACPRCGVAAGESCHYGQDGVRKGTHSPRIVRARKEAEGPMPYDVIYTVGGLKFRVIATYGDEVQMRRGTSHTIHRIARSSLSFDAIPGMWREKVAS